MPFDSPFTESTENVEGAAQDILESVKEEVKEEEPEVKEDVPTFDDIQDYTEEDFEIYLNRVKRDAIVKKWGEPSETSADTDTWVLNDKRTVTIIYDTSNRVKDAEVETTE